MLLMHTDEAHLEIFQTLPCCHFFSVSSSLLRSVVLNECVSVRALASPETGPRQASHHYMPVKCVKTCRETTLFFFTCVVGNRQFVPRPNMRALPLLQASHTPSSRCHSFHFLQSKVGGSAALPWVRYGRRVCSYQQPLDVWSGLFYLACGFTRQGALFVGVVGLTLSCSHTVLCQTPSRANTSLELHVVSITRLL